MSSPVIEIFKETKKTELTWMNERTPEPRFTIVSKVRERSGTAYLEATKREGEEIPVDFVGNEYNDTTEFFVGQDDKGHNTFSCYIEGQEYFLCADSNDNVCLMSSIGRNPLNDVRFLFNVERIYDGSKYCRIKSAQTRKFLVSHKETGEASMENVKSVRNRQAWFQIIQVQDDTVTDRGVHTIREDTVFAARTFTIPESVSCTWTKVYSK